MSSVSVTWLAVRLGREARLDRPRDRQVALGGEGQQAAACGWSASPSIHESNGRSPVDRAGERLVQVRERVAGAADVEQDRLAVLDVSAPVERLAELVDVVEATDAGLLRLRLMIRGRGAVAVGVNASGSPNDRPGSEHRRSGTHGASRVIAALDGVAEARPCRCGGADGRHAEGRDGRLDDRPVDRRDLARQTVRTYGSFWSPSGWSLMQMMMPRTSTSSPSGRAEVRRLLRRVDVRVGRWARVERVVDGVAGAQRPGRGPGRPRSSLRSDRDVGLARELRDVDVRVHVDPGADGACRA